MSKRFKNQTCTYCGIPNSSETEDHVFARQFFQVRHRGNLPKVAACTKCNNDKSKIEHYLSVVLPFGSRTRDAKTTLLQDVTRRLDKNLKLFRLLSSGVEHKWIKRNGLLLPQMTIPFDGEKLDELFVYITKGLLMHHWGVIPSNDCAVRTASINKEVEHLFEEQFKIPTNKKVSENLGEGTFIYQGILSKENPDLSIWRYKIMGGIESSDDDALSPTITSFIYGMTGRKEFVDRMWALLS